MGHGDDADEKSKRLLDDIHSLLAKVQASHTAKTQRRQREQEERALREKERLTFRLGDVVRIKSGPFAAFRGKIEGINQAKALLKVVVEIFGRVTPVKLKFSDVDEISLDE